MFKYNLFLLFNVPLWLNTGPTFAPPIKCVTEIEDPNADNRIAGKKGEH